MRSVRQSLRLQLPELAAQSGGNERGQLFHALDDARDAQVAQHLCVTFRDMARADERDRLHAGGMRRGQTRYAVFDDEAASGSIPSSLAACR